MPLDGVLIAKQISGGVETIRNCRDMSIEESYEYIMAKQEQLRFRDTENTRHRGMQDFLDDKKYRPGLTAVGRAE